MKDIITYDLWRLGKFLMWREEWENAYYVIKRDVFDKLSNNQVVKFTMNWQIIMNPSFADETIARFIKEYPNKVFVDKDLGYAVKKVFETLELTSNIEINYI